MFHYYLDNQGMECAKFIGKNGRSINVGYVVDKDANLFWTYERWFFHFDPETETAREPDPSLAKWNWVADKSMYSVSSNKITYGDSYFFDEFIKQISYDSIIRSCGCHQMDRLFSIIYFYFMNNAMILNPKRIKPTSNWYLENYVRYLFNSANFCAETFKGTLKEVGNNETMQRFFRAHIKFFQETTRDNRCFVFVPQLFKMSTFTLSDDKKQSFIPIVVFHQASRLPLFYHLLFKESVNAKDIQDVLSEAKDFGLRVSYVIEDCRYLPIPESMQHLLDLGVDFTVIVDTTITMLERANYLNLYGPDERCQFAVRDNRFRCSKAKEKLGVSAKIGEAVDGYRYLFEHDFMNAGIKLFDTFMPRLSVYGQSARTIAKICERCGTFSLFSTMDMPAVNVAWDYAISNNCKDFLYISNHFDRMFCQSDGNMELFLGHTLVSFITSFLISLIRRRALTVSRKYLRPLDTMSDTTATGASNIIQVEANGQIQRFLSMGDLVLDEPINIQRLFRWLKAQSATIDSKKIHPIRSNSKLYPKMIHQVEAFGIPMVKNFYFVNDAIETQYRRSGQRKLDWMALIANEPLLSDNEIDELLARQKGEEGSCRG